MLVNTGKHKARRKLLVNSLIDDVEVEVEVL